MGSSRIAVAALSMLMTWPAPVAAQRAVTLDGVARAMGGKERILGVRTLVLEGNGRVLNFGQNRTPYAEDFFEVTSFRRTIDYPNRRWLLDQTRVPRFPTANTNPQRQRLGVDAAVAYNIGTNNAMARVGGAAATDRARELLYQPIGFIQAAYAPGTEVSVEPVSDNIQRIRINPGGDKFAMHVDRATMLPTRIEKIVHHAMLGDVTLATELSNWRDLDGLKVPGQMVQRMAERWVLADYTITATHVNPAAIDNIAATDSVRRTTPLTPQRPNVVVEELAPGVWSLAGQSHHTIAIEQQRRVVLVEVPQSEARSLAAIASARALRPAKPVDLVINTHHHFDHSGGVRAAISEGLTIMTHAENRDFYERHVFPGQHFIMPDAQYRNPRPLRLIAVSDAHVITDSLRSIEVYSIDGSAHSGSMLVVYLPAERLLIQADLYNPPAANAANPVFPFLANLLENIQRRGLQVDRVVGIHGRPVLFSDLAK